MISCRSDFFKHIQSQRERFKLIIVMFPNFPDIAEDCAFVWAYTDEDQRIDIKEYSPIFLRNLKNNALDSLVRSFLNVNMDPTFDFAPDFPAFVNGPTLSDTRQRMYRETMKHTFEEMKAGAPLYVGAYDMHSNNKGVVFGIIELFKPKFNLGDKVRYKNQEGQIRDGVIGGLDFSSSEYSMGDLASEDAIWVKESDIYPAESK